MGSDPAAAARARSQTVLWWHRSLRTIAVLNIALWSLSAMTLGREYPSGAPDAARAQLLLSALYVAGCAFRSCLPVIDIPRIVLVDSRWSKVLVGRSVATIAELSFAAQWALLLHQVALSLGSPFLNAVSWAVVPFIVLAQACCWYAVLTTKQWAHAFENSLWGLAAALVVAGMLLSGPGQHLALYAPTVAGGALYVAFVFFYDVPMYWSRWLADQSKRRSYRSLSEGLISISRPGSVSYRWAHWSHEIPWMSLYFTFGVWSSIWLVHASLILGHRD
ncbi:MAG: hypothetical protein JO005_15140 [Gammaproteobacteria bacterium]|nr:hypothetical protein [Gammaproteobacteria bacterium]